MADMLISVEFTKGSIVKQLVSELIRRMGKILSKIFGNKEMRILMLGLDAAGKTSEIKNFMSCQIAYLTTCNYYFLFSKKSNTVQVEIRTVSHNNSHSWIQC